MHNTAYIRGMQNERQIREAADMRKLSKLILFATKIKPEELPLIRHYLSSGQKLNKKTQLLHLFDFLIENAGITTSDIYKAFPDLSARTIDNLAAKLTQKLLSAIVDENTYRLPGIRNEKQIAVLAVKDYSKQVLVLNERGLPILALDKVSELIDLAKEFELYTDLVAALYIKQSLIKIKSKPDELIELEAEISYYSQANDAVNRAEYVFEHLISILANTATRNANYTVVENGIKELRDLYGQTSASFVLYYLISLEITYFNEINKPEIANQKAGELLSLVKEKPALSGKQQLPICYMYLAQTNIGMYQFADALVYCELVKSLVPPGNWNYGETLLLEYYAHFYTNDFEKAYECIIKLTDTNDYPATLFKMNERRYLKTCCLMAMGKNIEAEQELGQIYQITKDKTGWNIGLRLLSVMLNYVNDKPENMLRTYENLQLELRRIKNLVSISERDRLIISVLREMLNNPGSLKYVAKKCSQTLEKMKAVNGNVAWQMFGHELLPFHQWFECKLQRRSFEVNLNYSDKNKQIPVS
jgi:hypothetical protein